MSELLTSKQVQNLLQVDRTTIYRMIKDGRLSGVKVGNQWRFPRQDIEALLSPTIPTRGESLQAANTLPLHCIQTVQDVFAEIAQVGAVTTDRKGKPLTNFSNSCNFCRLIMDSTTGFQACIQSWRQLAESHDRDSEFIPCHAGLQYARGYIKVDGEPVAMIVNGQFYVEPPDTTEETIRVNRLATVHQINAQELAQAALLIPRLDERKQAQIGSWMKKVARTFGEIGQERAEFLNRLKTISEMSSID